MVPGETQIKIPIIHIEKKNDGKVWTVVDRYTQNKFVQKKTKFLATIDTIIIVALLIP